MADQGRDQRPRLRTRSDVDFTNLKNTTTEAFGTSSARTTEEYFNAVGQTTS